MKWVFAIIVSLFILMASLPSVEAARRFGGPGWGRGYWGGSPYGPYPRYYRPYSGRYYPAYYGPCSGYYPYGAPVAYGVGQSVYFRTPGIVIGWGPGW